MNHSEHVEKMLNNWGKEYKKGFMGYFLLLLLKERSMYGFELSKKLSEISETRIIFQESGIYQLLKNLEKTGMISSEWKKSDKGPQRKYYKLAAPGEELLAAFTEDYILPIINTATKMVKKHFPDMNTLPG